jgi:hypothetical protein
VFTVEADGSVVSFVDPSRKLLESVLRGENEYGFYQLGCRVTAPMVWTNPDLGEFAAIFVQWIPIKASETNGLFVREDKDDHPIRSIRRVIGLLIPAV